MASSEELQQAILSEFSLQADSFAINTISMWWDFFSDRNQLLQYLYTRKRVAAYLLITLRKSIDVTLGTDKFSAQQRFENMLDVLKQISDEIKSEDPYGSVPYLESVQGEVAMTPSQLTNLRLLYVENCWSRYSSYQECFYDVSYPGSLGDFF